MIQRLFLFSTMVVSTMFTSYQASAGVGLFLFNTRIKISHPIQSEKIGHVMALLKIHPWFANEINVAEVVDDFFSACLKRDKVTLNEYTH